MGPENLAPTGVRTPDHSARSESLSTTIPTPLALMSKTGISALQKLEKNPPAPDVWILNLYVYLKYLSVLRILIISL